MSSFTEKQIRILKALAKYKFLTYDQLLKLGVEKHKSNLSTNINSLMNSRNEYILKIPHRPGQAAKFYLGKKSVNVLLDQTDLAENQIHLPFNKITSETQDQKHRTGIIDLQISLDLGLGNQSSQLLFCDRYFDSIGNNRVEKNLKSKTAIQYSDTSVKADMVFKLETPFQEELYIVELENGRDKKKSIQKCKEHAELLFEGSVHDRYEFKQGYRTLWVFEYSSTMSSTILEIQNDPLFENIQEYFLFNSKDNTTQDFFANWVNIQNFDRKLFYL